MINLFNSGAAKVRKARHGDIRIIAEDMRNADIREVWDSDHVKPYEALERSYGSSTLCFTITLKGVPIGMFGVVPFMLAKGAATIWLLGSNSLNHINKKLLRRSKDFIKIMLRQYHHLENRVSCDNTASIKWLKFCGASFSEPARYGAEKKNFMRFRFDAII